MALGLTTAGESHGPALVAILTGLPAGLRLEKGAIDADLRRRQQGYGRSPRQKLESDEVEVLAGLRHGLTLGTPLALVVRNRDHANWTWGMSPWPPGATRPARARNRSRSRDRGTPTSRGAEARPRRRPQRARARVGPAHRRPRRRGPSRRRCWRSSGSTSPGGRSKSAARRPTRGMREATDAARQERDTLGGVVEVVATGVPPGFGSYAEKADRLDARLAFALMGIQAVKGVEIGDGFALARRRGTEAHDEIDLGLARRTNRAGGIEAGVSNGEPIVVRAAMKPLPTLMRPLDSVDLSTGEPAQALVERSTCRRSRPSPWLRRRRRLRARARRARQARRRRDGRRARRAPRIPRSDRRPVASERLNALGRHLALAGFMGSGKTTAGRSVAGLLGRRFVDLDTEIETRPARRSPSSSRRAGRPGSARWRRTSPARCSRGEPVVVALGGGAALSERTRRDLAERAFTVLLDVDPATAWERVADTDRPLARSRPTSTRCIGTGSRSTRVSPTRTRATSRTSSAAATSSSSIDRSASSSRARGLALVADARRRHPRDPRPGRARRPRRRPARARRGGREDGGGAGAALVGAHHRAGRRHRGPGRGSTTDLAGFAAATHMRGVAWTAVPTTLVGQVDAGIGGKTAIDLPGAKNAVGAFHWPARVVCDPSLLTTLPDDERRNGLAEVVKTGLLAGRPLWQLAEPEQVRACAAFKAAVCLRDPHDRVRATS